jgi:hypothetical protein
MVSYLTVLRIHDPNLLHHLRPTHYRRTPLHHPELLTLTNKLKPEIKSKWLAALRSGKYIQGRGLLINRHPTNWPIPVVHCCLGVLCEVVAEENGTELLLYTDSLNKLPSSLLIEEAFEQLPCGAWSVMDPGVGPISLDVLNDSPGHDFNYIANIIEEQL